MKSDSKKDSSYNTIALNDDTTISANKNIVIKEDKDSIKNTSNVDNYIKANENTSGVVDKFKNYFKLGNSQNNKNGDIEGSGNKSNDRSIEIPTSNTNTNNEDNSCKQKLMKKLEENIEVEKSYKTFLILISIGLCVICLSLVFLPVVIISPYKFVMCFSLGSLLILSSFIFIYGTKSYFELLFSQNRFLFTLLFLGSILLGLVFAWSHYFLLSIFCSIFQLVSLIVFILSFIPGGKTGITFIGRMFSSPLTNMWMRIRGQSYLPTT